MGNTVQLSGATSVGALLIWDLEKLPPTNYSKTILWRSFGNGASTDVISLPQLIEENAAHLRSRYLSWVYELGTASIDGRRLIDHLELRPGFSYWWMTLFAEKCNFAKSPQIDDAIRLMALEDWATNQSISRIVLASASQPLSECIRMWCAKSGVAFEWQKTVKPPEYLPWLQRVYQTAPHALQALIWLPRYLIDRWPLRGVGLKGWGKSDGRITFFSYLFNLVPDAANQGRYESRYWAQLPDALTHQACKTNWFHLYIKDPLLPTSKHAANMVRAFNSTGQDEQRHVTLDTFLSLSVIFRTLIDWWRLYWIGIRLGSKLRAKQGATLNLWPLFEDDWPQSMYGPTAMSNLLNFNLIDAALKCLPKQQRGVYLQENLGWEFALIQAWHAAGHGRLMGAPHSTIRFWDLRYFFDPRSYLRSGNHDLPLPTQVTVNGPAAWDAYKNGGYPVDELVGVEALRYLHLCKATTAADTSPICVPTKHAVRVLVLGDYLISNTERQMNLLEQAASSLPASTVFTVKSHPSCPIHLANYPGLSMVVTMEPIAKLLAECDVAYASAVTSAAVDAYCAGVPIVSLLDPNTLNLSPLRGHTGALFASTPDELATALMTAATTPQTLEGQNDFFTLDPQLPRWRKLLLDSIE